MDLPVVFLSITLNATPSYVPKVVEFASETNDVVFLGDDGNTHIPNHVNMCDYWDGAHQFEQVYHHLSTNNERVELFCFQRWFVLRDWMKANNIHRCFHMDTDILVFGMLEFELEYFEHLYCALSGRTSGHSSYWSLKGLEKFCEYLMEVYSNPDSYDYAKHANHYYLRKHYGLDGGLCDMTLLESFARYKYPHMVGELSIFEKNRRYFDHIISAPEGFEFNGERKVFQFIGRMPHGHYYYYDDWGIPFNTIHFQGANKRFIDEFIERSRNSINKPEESYN